VTRDLLADAAPQERAEALRAVEDALDALNLLLDGVWNAYCREAAA
jgi:hypothetical protein